MGIFITAGENLLPDGFVQSDIFSLCSPVVSHGSLDSHNGNNGNNGNIVECCIDNNAFSLPEMDKVVRRVSNAQSRWLLQTGITTYLNNSSLFSHVSPEQRGLFLGLATSDSDDDIVPIAFDANSSDEYITRAMVEMQPLIGLTLLNSSTASHLSLHLDIQGDNAFFSPHIDAGANALVEGFYSVSEGRSRVVLCGGGSQRISPWFYLANDKWLKSAQVSHLAEASSCIVIHSEQEQADCQLSAIKRTSIYNQQQYINFLTSILDKQFAGQVIHTGLIGLPSFYTEAVATQFPQSAQFILDRQIGYCAAALPFIAINGAIYLKRKQLELCNVTKSGVQRQSVNDKTIILVHGLNQQCFAVSLNFSIK